MKTIRIIALLIAAATTARAAIPVSGRPVPEMTIFDTTTVNFMEQNGVEAAVVGIMRDSKVVYLRGFGSMDDGVNMPENAMVRQASATKPATAAAIRKLAAEGAFGPEGLERRAFNITWLGVNNNGLLTIAPSPSLGGSNIRLITIRHLLEHKGGFDRDDADGPGDTPLKPRTIAAALGVPSPPSRTQVINYTLGWPLSTSPGTTYAYSNFGYLVLGEIIAQVWPGGYVDCLHTKVFTPELWVPRSEMEAGFTLRDNHHDREPWYRGSGSGSSVFDNTPPIETLPGDYGGSFAMQTIMAHGGLIASAPAMLALGDEYRLGYPSIGSVAGSETDEHNGALFGMLSLLRRRSDGTVIYIFLNRRFIEDSAFNDVVPIDSLRVSITSLLDAGPGAFWQWPAANTTSDGFWVIPTSVLPDTGLGGYNSSWRGFGNALTKADSNSRLRIRPGTTAWTGTINKRLRLDAPLGQVRIGFQ